MSLKIEYIKYKKINKIIILIFYLELYSFSRTDTVQQCTLVPCTASSYLNKNVNAAREVLSHGNLVHEIR